MWLHFSPPSAMAHSASLIFVSNTDKDVRDTKRTDNLFKTNKKQPCNTDASNTSPSRDNKTLHHCKA